MSLLRPGRFLVCRALTRNTSRPCCGRISNTGIQYTPVDCIATLRTPRSTSQSAICSRSAVKQSKQRTGCSSRSGLMATQCSLPPMSMPAACECTISRAFQSPFSRSVLSWLLLCPFLLITSPIGGIVLARPGSDKVQDSPTAVLGIPAFLLTDTKRREDTVQDVVGCSRSSDRIYRTQRAIQIQQQHLMRDMLYNCNLSPLQIRDRLPQQLLVTQAGDETRLLLSRWRNRRPQRVDAFSRQSGDRNQRLGNLGAPREIRLVPNYQLGACHQLAILLLHRS